MNNSPFLCSIFDLVTHGQAPAIHRHIQVRGSRSGRMADDIFMNLRSFLEVDILVIAWAYLVARKPRKMWPPKNSINMDKNFSHNTLSFFFFLSPPHDDNTFSSDSKGLLFFFLFATSKLIRLIIFPYKAYQNLLPFKPDNTHNGFYSPLVFTPPLLPSLPCL